MKLSTVTSTALSLAAVAACTSDSGAPAGDTGINDADGDSTTATPPADTGSTAALGDSTTGDSGGAEGSTTFPEPPVKLDLGLIPDSPEIESGCRAVDFLFVIDNSGSMGAYQTNLVNNFPAFIDGIQSTLTEVDSYHVGIATTDAYQWNGAGCNLLGAMVTSTGGTQSSNAVCGPYTDGFNFMTETDDLGTSFACAARVGTSGSSTEAPMDAVTTVANGVYAGPGLCNEGFLRDDALWVIVVITDEADGPGDVSSGSSGNPMTWYDAVVAAKNDTPENAAAVAIVNYNGGPCPPSGSFEDGQNMVDWANMFGDNGFVGGICEADYGPLFDQVVGLVENACENFIPPG